MENMTQKDRFIYKSSYDRGLEHLLKLWPDIKKELPDATLQVCYGWSLFDLGYANNPYMMKWKEEINKLMEQDGITHHGRVSKNKLDEITANCDMWVYPTHFEETNCHPSGTFIETDSGDIAIENLTLSNLVRTSTGNYKKITAIRSKKVNELIYTITPKNSEDFKVTGDHPVLAIITNQNDRSKSFKERINKNPEWVKASDLKVGDILLSSRKVNVDEFNINLEPFIGGRKNNFKTENNEINTEFTNEKALWFGYFAGDGSASSRGSISILVAKSHIDRDLQPVIDGFKSWGLEPTVKEFNGFLNVRVYSYVLARFLRHYFYDYNKNKKLPKELLKNQLVLKGLINSDGHTNLQYNDGKGISKNFTNISRKLVSQVRLLLNNAGITGRITKRVHKIGNLSYSLSWTEVENRILNTYEKDENFIYTRIAKITTENFNDVVYNIDVEDEHNYHANGIIVHNCITALDSQKLGCVPVTMNLAALQDTVFSGVKIDGDITEQETKDLFVKELVSLAKDKKRFEEEKIKAIEGSKVYDWSNIATEWAKHFK